MYLIFFSCVWSCSHAQTNTPTPIPWEYIAPQDILWKKRVWRQIDLREKNNAPMSNDSLIPKEYVFANLLLFGLKNGTIKAYADEDTGFKNPISVQKIDSIIPCGEGCVYPKQVGYYKIIEDWIFDKEKGVMVVRILAIAPAVNVNGNIKPLFWLYYPDCRNLFAQYEVFNPRDDIARYTWDEYFESRQFSSKIIKVEPSQVQEIQENGSNKKHKKKKRKEKN
jgi:gliding motility associated protien GldN